MLDSKAEDKSETTSRQIIIQSSPNREQRRRRGCTKRLNWSESTEAVARNLLEHITYLVPVPAPEVPSNNTDFRRVHLLLLKDWTIGCHRKKATSKRIQNHLCKDFSLTNYYEPLIR